MEKIMKRKDFMRFIGISFRNENCIQCWLGHTVLTAEFSRLFGITTAKEAVVGDS